jgi:hypothetical protein
MVAINLPKRAAACLIKPARKRDRQIYLKVLPYRSSPRRATRPLGYAWTLLISSHLSSFVHVVTVTYRPLKSTRPTTKLRGESCPPWPISTGQWRSYVACRLNRRFFVPMRRVLSPSYLWRNGGAAPGPDLTLAEQCAVHPHPSREPSASRIKSCYRTICTNYYCTE